MEDLFNSAINHLEQLVSFDTSNPPRAISESGLLDYLEAMANIKTKIRSKVFHSNYQDHM